MIREYLTRWREEQRKSQQVVADSVGITQQYYQLIEAGKRQQDMGITLVGKLADAFGKTFEEVVTEEEEWKAK